MAENLHDIDNLFRSGLEDSEEVPSNAVWEGVKQYLDKQAKPPLPGKLTWLKRLSVAASLIMLASAIYFVHKEPGVLFQEPVAELNRPETVRPEADLQKNKLPAGRLSEIQKSAQRKTDKVNIQKDQNTNSDFKPVEKKSLLPLTETMLRKSIEPGIPEESKNNPDIVSTSINSKESNNSRPLKNKSVNTSNEQEANKQFKDNETTKNPETEMVVVRDKTTNAMPGIGIKEFEGSDAKKIEPNTIENSYVQTQILESNPTKPEWTKVYNQKTIIANTTNSTVLNNSVSAANSLKLKPTLIPKFSITPVATVNITKNNIQENRSFGGRNGREHKEFKQTEQNKTTISPGLLADFRLSPAISLQTGISELRNNISISTKMIPAIRDNDGKVRYRLDCSAGSYFIDPKTGTTPQAGDTINISASEIKLNYASVPFIIKFNAGSTKLRYYGLAGIDYNFLTNKNSSTVLQGNLDEKLASARTEGLKTNYFNGVIGGGIDIMISKKIAFSFMPQYRFAIKSINEKSPVNSFPSSISFISGFKFTL